MSERTMSSLLTGAEEVLTALPESKPEFELTVRWASNYDELFAKSGELTSELEILDRTLKRGRCILVGRGGGGKTRLLHRVMRRAIECGWVPVLVDLKEWTGGDYEAWRTWTAQEVGTGVAFLLERFSHPKTDAMTLDGLRPEIKKVLIVDGLNEIALSVGQQILLALDEAARNIVGLSVLVADRLNRRDLPSLYRWSIGAVQPISSEQIARHINIQSAKTDDLDTLSSPYFLDAAIRKEAVGASRAENLERFLLTHGKLSPDELWLLSRAAFEAYARRSTRTIPYSEFVPIIGEPLVTRLLEAGMIVRLKDSEVHFNHHLLHDYLAAKHVSAMQQDARVPEVFQAISFGGSSFDAIAMVFSLLKPGEADQFLRQVYDWNPYAAAYALAEVTKGSASPSEEMQTVIFAMLAEKRAIDRIEPTTKQAQDALALFDTGVGARIGDCTSLEEVFQFVLSIESTHKWFDDWRRLFTIPSAGDLATADLQQISSADSVTGWTVANVARRAQLTSEQQEWVRMAASRSNATIQWRVAHVLGAWPSAENREVLSNLLAANQVEYVRYGAVRSLIEAASRGSDDFRRQVIQVVAAQSRIIASNRKLVEEARRAMTIKQSFAPSSWLNFVRSVSEMLYREDDSLEVKEAWQRWIADAELRYSQKPNEGIT